jgi:hypothetical protein
MKCPGSDNRYIYSKNITCKCGEILEVFSDEKFIRCYKCKEVCMVNGTPKCLEWCKFAEKCKNDWL